MKGRFLVKGNKDERRMMRWMREFPANAVMERRMLIAAKESDSC